MATLRSDVIIPEVFTPYVIEQTTLRDAFRRRQVQICLASFSTMTTETFFPEQRLNFSLIRNISSI